MWTSLTATTQAPPPSTTTTATTPASTAAAPTTAEPTPTAPSVTVPPVAAPPLVAAPTPQMLAASTGYLNARENASSGYQTGPNAWLAQAQAFMTPQGYATLAQAAGTTAPGAGSGFEYQAMHQYGWKVAVTASCTADLAGPTPTATTYTLTCTVTDQTVTLAGAAVPAGSLPQVWPLNGPQSPAILAMVNTGPAWLVDVDQSGG